MGPPGDPGIETQWVNTFYTVASGHWELVGGQDALNSYYRCIFDEPLLTDFIYKEGVVQGYLVVNPGTRDETLRPLPDDMPYAERVDASYADYWAEYITFDYMPGSVAFYVTYSDFSTHIAPPDMKFKLVMIY
jgi:hypothetical protein